MAILDWAHEHVAVASENFTPNSAAPTDTTYARVGLDLDSISDYVELSDFSAVTTGDLWAHCRFDNTDSASGAAFAGWGLIRFRDGSTDVLQINPDSPNWEIRVNNSTVVNTGVSAASVLDNAEHVVDARLNIQTGQFDLYADGVLIYSDTLTLTATQITNVRFGGTGDTLNLGFEFLVCDEPTVGWRMATKTVNAAGNYTAQTSGLFSDIDEADPDRTDKLVFDTSGTRASFATNSPPAIGGGDEIKGIGIAWEAQRTASGPNRLTPFMRHTATDYDGTQVALDAAWVRGKELFTTNLDKDCEIGVLAETV